MFFPLNDTEPNRYSPFPVMTTSLIIVNTLVFFLLPIHNGLLYRFLANVPELIYERVGGSFLTGLLSMFLHGGFFHLFGNMFALWVFGRRVEDACGTWRFLAFYLFVGYASTLVFNIVNAGSDIPVIGASGAIFGVMGAYLILYPGGRIRTFILWFSLVPTWPRLRAIWVVLYFLALQIIPAFDILLNGSHEYYSMAYWGHLGGFLASVGILFFLRPESFARYLSDADV